MSKYFKCFTDKNPLSYALGEEVIFTVFAREDGKIRIEGSKANWIYDIIPENVPPVRCPKIFDFSIDLKI